MLKSAMKFAAGMMLIANLVAPTAHAADLVKVKMAEVVRSQFYLPMYIALAKGFVKDEGLDVQLVTTNGGDRAGALLLSGQADFALAGPEVPIYIYNGESPDKPVIFCALTATDGFFLASRKKIDHFEWSMLNGKTLIGARPGSTPELYFEYAMKLHKVDPATIKSVVTNIGDAAHDGAWIAGKGDFSIFREPNLTKMETSGNAHLVASIGKQIGRADYTLFFAKKSWLAAHRDIAQKWTNAIARAQAWMQTADVKEIATLVAPFFPGMSVEDSMTVVNRYRSVGVQIWATNPLVDKDGLMKAEEIMVSGGTLPADKIVPYDKLVDTSFAEAAQKKLATQ
jgi:NitT/TauT family transport system substrate-binding protein